MADELFDRAHFDHMTGADRALQAELIDLFRGQAALWDKSLQAPLEPDALGDLAHTVKGSARGLGFWVLAAAAEAAEICARAGTGAEIFAAAQFKLRATLAQTLGALDESLA